MNRYVVVLVKGLEAKWITKEGAWRQVEDANTMWEAITKCIQMSIKEILGISRRGGSKMKRAWWWNEDAKEKAKEKKEAYAAFMNSTDENCYCS